MSTATLEATLKFVDYPARAWSGPVAKPRQDTRFARLFRTVLNLGAAAGPNFAGHMTIVEFGCGTSCVEWGLVDARTGQVHRPDATPLTLVHVGDDALKYRRDSRSLKQGEDIPRAVEDTNDRDLLSLHPIQDEVSAERRSSNAFSLTSLGELIGMGT